MNLFQSTQPFIVNDPCEESKLEKSRIGIDCRNERARGMGFDTITKVGDF